jgi:Tol biopolymer transport system component
LAVRQRVVILAAALCVGAAVAPAVEAIVARGSGHEPVSGIVVSADRAPAFTDQIYVVDSTGHRTNLSHSPYADIQPTLSPDGKRVAFLRTIGTGEFVYVVDIDGRHQQRVSSSLGVQGPNATGVYMVWSPDSRGVEINTGAGAYVVGSHLKQRRVLGSARAGSPASWSPDGRLIAIPSDRSIDVVTRTGRLVWRVGLVGAGATWSRSSFLGVATGRGFLVYDRRGRLVAHGRADLFAWSRDGRWFAHLVGRRLEVRTPRGRLVLARRLKPVPQDSVGVSGYTLVWAGSRSIVVTDASGGWRLAVAVPGGSAHRIPAINPTYTVSSPDGLWLADPVPSRAGYALRVERFDGRDARTFARVPACPGYSGIQPAIAYPVQLTPDANSIVYQTDCLQPFVNLYLVSQTGKTTRVTWDQGDETDPQWSPDGRSIAFLRGNGPICHECIWSVWVASANGTHARQVTFPGARKLTFPGQAGAPPGESDDTPSWSPDGRLIAFYRGDYIHAHARLLVVPASGGQPHSVHAATPPSWVRTRLDQTRSRTGRIAYLDQALPPVSIVILGNPIRRIRLPFQSVAGLAWSPDGLQFALTARRTIRAPLDVYTIGVDGRHLKRLTHDLDATGASWR